MKNTFIFTWPTVQLIFWYVCQPKYEELSKNPNMCNPIAVVNYWKCSPLYIVNSVVKMRSHPAAHPHYFLIRKYPLPSGIADASRCIEVYLDHLCLQATAICAWSMPLLIYKPQWLSEEWTGHFLVLHSIMLSHCHHCRSYRAVLPVPSGV